MNFFRIQWSFEVITFCSCLINEFHNTNLTKDTHEETLVTKINLLKHNFSVFRSISKTFLLLAFVNILQMVFKRKTIFNSMILDVGFLKNLLLVSIENKVRNVFLNPFL